MTFAKFKIANIGKFEAKNQKEFEDTVDTIKLKVEGIKKDPVEIKKLKPYNNE